jgi:hypothetical protein
MNPTIADHAVALGDSSKRSQSRLTHLSARPGWFLGRPFTVWRAALQPSRRFPYS